MIVRYCDEGDAEYREVPIEHLSEAVDDLAAVAWDRDAPEILGGVELRSFEGGCPGSLRFFNTRASSCLVFTDVDPDKSRCIAFWDWHGLRWRRKTTDAYAELVQRPRPRLFSQRVRPGTSYCRSQPNLAVDCEPIVKQ